MIFPHTASRRVRLHPATADDQMGFRASVNRAGFGQGGHEARTPGDRPARDAAKPYAGFVVSHRRDDHDIGFGTLHSLDDAGHIRLRVILDPRRSRLGVGAEALFLLINYAFATLPVEKVITQTTEASFGALGVTSDDDPAHDSLTEHVYFRGRLWDLHYFEVKRDHWDGYIDRKLVGVLPAPMSWRMAPDTAADIS